VCSVQELRITVCSVQGLRMTVFGARTKKKIFFF
jgi:hypothetical protein